MPWAAQSAPGGPGFDPLPVGGDDFSVNLLIEGLDNQFDLSLHPSGKLNLR